MALRGWRLGVGLRAAAKIQHKAGDISDDQYSRLVWASRDREAMERVLRQLTVNENALGGIDWAGIRDWIIQNWPTILRIVLSIVILLDPKDEQ